MVGVVGDSIDSNNNDDNNNDDNRYVQALIGGTCVPISVSRFTVASRAIETLRETARVNGVLTRASERAILALLSSRLNYVNGPSLYEAFEALGVIVERRGASVRESGARARARVQIRD